MTYLRRSFVQFSIKFVKRFRKKEVALTWSLGIIKLKRKRKNIFKAFKRNKNINELKKCKILDKEIRALMHKKRVNRLEKHLGNFSNSKSLWQGVKTILNTLISEMPKKCRQIIPSLKEVS